jgi:hypothetical protein
VDVTMVASRSDAHGSEEAPGRHSHTGETDPPDVVTVDRDGDILTVDPGGGVVTVDSDGGVVTVVWLTAGFVGLEPHAATSNATLTTASKGRKPTRLSDVRLTTANYLPRRHKEGSPPAALGVDFFNLETAGRRLNNTARPAGTFIIYPEIPVAGRLH